ncbi:MAG: hypothetical protein MUF78_10095 [Candidatus Edwardsbacteria bacterium]|jgi:hypothetical protein|nr:hypothetical protein [Candidatus Edwardsbacteria bacterium]
MQVKGSAIAVLPKFIAEKHGADGLRKWQEALSPGARKIFHDGVMLSEWYPITEAYLEPTALLCALFYGGDTAGALAVGRYSAEYALKGIYKAFVKLSSVKSFISRANTVMTTYYKPSAMEIASVGPDRLVLHMTIFPTPSEHAELRIAGWIQRSLEIHGCKDVSWAIPRSFTKKDPLTELVFTWH